MIDPNREYSIKEIVALKLIPGVKGYAKVYNIITTRKLYEMGVSAALETTRTSIKSETKVGPGNQIHSKHLIKGSEIIKFLALNKI